MDRPEFISVPFRDRFVRVRPAAIAWLQLDGLGNAVIHFIGGETMSTGVTPDELEALAAGEAAAASKPRAAAAPRKKAA